MKYPFVVKHNGVYYEPGQEVPIGKEPVKENENEDKSVNEIKAELKELGVTKFPSNKKADLIALLEETKANLESEDNEDENEEEVTDEETESEDEEVDNDVTENEDEESDLMDEIVNE